MTIDDLIEKYKAMATKGNILFPQRPDIAEKSNLQYAKTVELLEELKAYRANEGMSENVYRCGYKFGYNKCVDDFSRELSDKIMSEIDDCAEELQWIDEIAKQLKER